MLKNNFNHELCCSSVEISSSLAQKQLETVGEVSSHSKKFRVECRDAADPSGWGMVALFMQPFLAYCFCIFFILVSRHNILSHEPWFKLWFGLTTHKS